MRQMSTTKVCNRLKPEMLDVVIRFHNHVQFQGKFYRDIIVTNIRMDWFILQNMYSNAIVEQIEDAISEDDEFRYIWKTFIFTGKRFGIIFSFYASIRCFFVFVAYVRTAKIFPIYALSPKPILTTKGVIKRPKSRNLAFSFTRPEEEYSSRFNGRWTITLQNQKHV